MKAFNHEIEALRGFAAITVMVAHLIFFRNIVDLSISGFGVNITNGHYCVLLFFMISGYVIGISHKPGAVQTGVVTYLKKRFLRLYPIYLVAMLFCFFIDPAMTGLMLAGNLLFLQDIVVSIPASNTPNWSLTFEVIYYYLFPFWRGRQRWVMPVALLCLAAGFLLLFPSLRLWALYYVCGYVFWLIGLHGAWNMQSDTAPVPVHKLVALLLMAYLVPLVDPVFMIFNRYYERVGATVVDVMDFVYLPSLLLIFITFANLRIRFRWVLEAWTFLMPALYFAYHIRKNHTVTGESIILALVFYVMAVFLYWGYRGQWLDKALRYFMMMLTGLGKISYAIYIIHFPIMVAVGYIPWGRGPHMYGYRVLFILALTLGFAWVLERVYQPWIRNRLDPKKPD